MPVLDGADRRAPAPAPDGDGGRRPTAAPGLRAGDGSIRFWGLAAQHAAVDYGAVAGTLGSPPTCGAERRLRRQGEAILELLGLARLRDDPVAGLPYGTLKRVEIATALATDPDLLLLDEPGSGMGPEEADQLGDELLALRRGVDLPIGMNRHPLPLGGRVGGN